MLNSVRTRLLLSSLLISLVTILSVGVVTLFLVDAYFGRQEREYLRSQAELFSPTVTQAIVANDVLALRREVALISYANQVRLRVRDAQGELLADSGEQDGLPLFNPISSETAEVLVGIVIDDSGQIVSMSPPVSRRSEAGGAIGLSLVGPSHLFDTRSSFVAISDASYQAPLTQLGRTWGYLELSEGPAVGRTVINNIRLALAGGSLVALIVAAVIGLLAARQVTRPLLALGEAVEAMSDDNLSARAPGSRLREFDRLAAQFNRMGDRLAETIDRLKREREGLRHMIADASHELRTPLTALKTFNSLLRQEFATNETATTFLNESEKQLDQLDRLTSGMLDLSRFEARLSGTNFVRADLRLAIEAAVQAVAPVNGELGHDLVVQLPDEPVWYQHDPNAIETAVSNLLQNAIKFSLAGSKVKIRLRTGQTAHYIAVEDEGPGIPPEIQSRVFDRFYRDPQQSQSGSGLGLAICREIVAIHQGYITLDSDCDQGSVFTIILPVGNEEETPT